MYIGNLALHDIKGVTNIILYLSFFCSNALDAIIAGTEQPKPNIIGINALPESPSFPIIPSIT